MKSNLKESWFWNSPRRRGKSCFLTLHKHLPCSNYCVLTIKNIYLSLTINYKEHLWHPEERERKSWSYVSNTSISPVNNVSKCWSLVMSHALPIFKQCFFSSWIRLFSCNLFNTHLSTNFQKNLTGHLSLHLRAVIGWTYSDNQHTRRQLQVKPSVVIYFISTH